MQQNDIFFPYSEEAERAVIGALLLESDTIYQAAGKVRSETFFDSKNGVIFNACLEMFAKGIPIDMISVIEYLQKKNQLDAIGGRSYIAQVTQRVNSADNIHHHLLIINQHYIAREQIKLYQKAANMLQNGSDAFEIIETVNQKIFNLTDNITTGKQRGIKEITKEFLDNTVKAMKSGSSSGVPSGFALLDSMLGGFQNSDLIILAARPGVGKTELVVNITEHAARSGFGGAFFSLEMKDIQIVQRMILRRTHVDNMKLRSGRITEQEYKMLSDASNELINELEGKYFIDDTPGISLYDLKAKILKLKKQHSIKWVVLDYLQLAKGLGKSRVEEIGSLTRGLKEIAKECDIPIIALSQLSRAVEQRSDKRPQLSDLRESGEIEQDADIVLFIYRPEYYGIETDENGNSLKGVAYVIIAKNRHGALDDIPLNFKGGIGFSDIISYQTFDETKIIDFNKNDYLNNSNGIQDLHLDFM